MGGRNACYAFAEGMFRSGDRVGDYDIVARLKSGGMATLYLAKRSGASGFQRKVAIKVVHPHLAQDPVFTRMFVREALLSSKIHHPNVVHVEELREVEGRHYLVMEFVPGCSLKQLMNGLARRRRRLTPELAVFIAINVADGLHSAHEARNDEGELLGVVHRDVTPENILISWQGHIKLIDFGVAKARMHADETSGNQLKGKLRYMAPEQALGSDVDRRTDVYTLGICLWEMLTMKRMFSGDADLYMLNQVRSPVHRPPSDIIDGLPADLDDAVLHALRPEPDERFHSARELRRSLARAVPGALTLDAADLSELIAIVMADQITEQRERLAKALRPGELPAEMALDEAAEEKTLMTMTVSVADIEMFEDSPSDSPNLASDDAAASALAAALMEDTELDAPPTEEMAPPMEDTEEVELERSATTVDAKVPRVAVVEDTQPDARVAPVDDTERVALASVSTARVLEVKDAGPDALAASLVNDTEPEARVAKRAERTEHTVPEAPGDRPVQDTTDRDIRVARPNEKRRPPRERKRRSERPAGTKKKKRASERPQHPPRRGSTAPRKASAESDRPAPPVARRQPDATPDAKEKRPSSSAPPKPAKRPRRVKLARTSDAPQRAATETAASTLSHQEKWRQTKELAAARLRDFDPGATSDDSSQTPDSGASSEPASNAESDAQSLLQALESVPQVAPPGPFSPIDATERIPTEPGAKIRIPGVSEGPSRPLLVLSTLAAMGIAAVAAVLIGEDPEPAPTPRARAQPVSSPSHSRDLVPDDDVEPDLRTQVEEPGQRAVAPPAPAAPVVAPAATAAPAAPTMVPMRRGPGRLRRPRADTRRRAPMRAMRTRALAPAMQIADDFGF